VLGASPRFLLGLALFFAIIQGCGFEKVKKPQNIRVEPANTGLDGQGFALAGEAGSRNFAGSLLVWKPETTRQDVVAILNATRQYNEAYTRSRQVIASLYDNGLRDIDGRKSALLIERAQGGGAAGQGALALRDKKMSAASSWFEGRLDELEQVALGGTFDKDRARRIFVRYCDAKLWELATHPMVADGTFGVRPTPSPLCEQIYLDRDYFSAPQCQVTEGQPRSFFECIWESLSRTTFVTEGPLDANKHGPMLRALAKSPELRLLISGRGTAPSFCGLDSLGARKIRTFRVLLSEPCTVPRTGVPFDMNVPTESRATSPLERMSPASVAAAWDDQVSRVTQDRLLALYPKELLLVPSLGPRAGRELSAAEVAGDGVASQVSSIDKRGVKCGSLAEGFAAGDVLLNLPFAVEGPMADGQIGNVGSVLGSEEGCLGMPDPDEFPELLAEQGDTESRRRAIDDQLAKLAADRDALLTRYCDMNNGLAESQSRKSEIEARPIQTAMVDERAILATRDLRLDLEPVGPGALKARLRFGPGTAPVEGCYAALDAPEAGASLVCPSPGGAGGAEGLGVVAAEVRVATQDGSLLLSFPLNAATLQSTGLSARLGEFEGTVFRVELFANAFEGLVPYLSGAVRLERDAEVVARGVASYLIEANAAYEEANAVVRECPRLGY
jgi:hypothetical protein